MQDAMVLNVSDSDSDHEESGLIAHRNRTHSSEDDIAYEPLFDTKKLVIYYWSPEKTGSVGHVSLQTNQIYASLWPQNLLI